MLSRCFNPSKSFTSKLPNLCTLKTFRSVHLLLSGKAKPHWNVMQHASKCNLCLHRFMVYKSRPSFDFVYLSPPTIKMTYTSASNTGLPGNVVEPLPGNLLCIGATLISDILCGKNDGRLVLEFWRPPFSRIFQDFHGSCNLGKAHDYMLTQMASPEFEEISGYSSTSLSLLGNLMRIKQNSYKVLEFLVFRLLEHCYPNQWWRNPSTRLSNSSKSMAPRRTQYPPASTSWLFRRMPSYLPNPWRKDGHAKVFSATQDVSVFWLPNVQKPQKPHTPTATWRMKDESQGAEGTSISFCSGEVRHLQTWFKCSVTASIPSLPHWEKLLKLFWICVFNSFCSSALEKCGSDHRSNFWLTCA